MLLMLVVIEIRKRRLVQITPLLNWYCYAVTYFIYLCLLFNLFITSAQQ